MPKWGLASNQLFCCKFQSKLEPWREGVGGGVFGFVYAEPKKGSLLLKRPDLKYSELPPAASVSYAIPLMTGANLWKYTEVISLEIHPGREWREIQARGRKLGLDPAKSETEASCVPAASTIHANAGPRSSESENGGQSGPALLEIRSLEKVPSSSLLSTTL